MWMGHTLSIPHLFTTAGVFPPSGCCEFAAVNVGVQISLQVPASPAFGSVPRVGLPEHVVTLCLDSEDPPDCFHSGCPTSHSPRSASGPPFLHVLETTCLFNIDNSHLGWCEVTAHCDFTTWFVNKFFLALSPAYSLQILPGRFCRISRQHWKRHLLPLLAGSLLTLV